MILTQLLQEVLQEILLLTKFQKKKNHLGLCFLDSGDFLKPNLFNKISDTDLFPTNELVVGQAIIMQADQNQYLRISLPLMLRYVINPIYLGHDMDIF